MVKKCKCPVFIWIYASANYWYSEIQSWIWFYCDWSGIRLTTFTLYRIEIFEKTNFNVSKFKYLNMKYFNFCWYSGGCVMANRLSENLDWKVLLLEVGDEESDFLTDVPLTAAVTVLTSNFFFHWIFFLKWKCWNEILFEGHNWGYRTEHEKSACLYLEGGVCYWPKGRALGGTSVINYMVYNRGHADDYNRWAKAGNKGNNIGLSLITNHLSLLF